MSCRLFREYDVYPLYLVIPYKGAVVCLECATDEEEVLAKESDLILDKDLENEDVIYFCDRCGKRLPV